jgi:hypothetical protein
MLTPNRSMVSYFFNSFYKEHKIIMLNVTTFILWVWYERFFLYNRLLLLITVMVYSLLVRWNSVKSKKRRLF